MPLIAAKHRPRGVVGNQAEGWPAVFSRALLVDHLLRISFIAGGSIAAVDLVCQGNIGSIR
jgi:hypothetical protein